MVSMRPRFNENGQTYKNAVKCPKLYETVRKKEEKHQWRFQSAHLPEDLVSPKHFLGTPHARFYVSLQTKLNAVFRTARQLLLHIS